MMKQIPLNKVFDIKYGNQFDLNKLTLSEKGIAFVSRTFKNNGVSAWVDPYLDIEPYSLGLITVALGGSTLSTFVQQTPFYTAQNIKVLIPKTDMSLREKLIYCAAIKHNRFRYTSHGREANKTFDSILIPHPDEIRNIARRMNIPQKPSDNSLINVKIFLHDKEWKYFEIRKLFKVKKGKRLIKADMIYGNTPFIGAIDSNNGYREFIATKPLHKSNTITVNYNGSVAESFYQPKPFWASDDVNILYPKFKMNLYLALFIVSVIRLEKYRFSYGRKWGKAKMEISTIKLPIDSNEEPNWQFMEEYIKSLPYSSNL